MKPGRHAVVQAEFEEWMRDMNYEALSQNPATRAYLFEAFVGGWGAKNRLIKKRDR